MEFNKARYLLEKSGILAERRNLQFSYNKVRFHNQYETAEHLLTKAFLAFLIFKKNEASLTEVDLSSGETPDNLQVKKNGELVFYEIIGEKEESKSYDFIAINLKDMPEPVKEAIKEFRKWLEKYIV